MVRYTITYSKCLNLSKLVEKIVKMFIIEWSYLYFFRNEKVHFLVVGDKLWTNFYQEMTRR